MEIIEIGASVIELRSAETLDTHQVYIRPVVNPKLTSFCVDLTGIQQIDVDSAPFFYSGIEQFTTWLHSHSNVIAWASWGAYDRNQLDQDCARHQQSNPLSALKHLNLKTAYAAAVKTRSKGMANAFKEQKLDMVGRHHSGVDDAKNIARLVRLTPNFLPHLKSLI